MSDYKQEYKEQWIGVDFDGSLVEYHGWKGSEHIGRAIMPMVERVRGWLAEGKDVRIMTARVSPKGEQDGMDSDAAKARVMIKSWCFRMFGRTLPVTHEKDYNMSELWDDRVVQLEFNTGEPVTGKLETKIKGQKQAMVLLKECYENDLKKKELGFLSEDQIESFHALCKPVMEWLDKNYHPHCRAIIDSTGAELCEGVLGRRHNPGGET